MKRIKKHAQHFVPHTQLPLSKSLVVLSVFFIAALLGIQLLKASSFFTGSEAETGTLAGNAATVDGQGASNGQAVLFGSGPAGLTGLRAYTGGDSIALVWDVPAVTPTIDRYEVYRNGTRIATTAPNTTVGGLRYGTQYVDRDVAAGQTYTYQIKAIGPNDAVSTLSSSITATHPTDTTPVPNVTINPEVAGISPELDSWFREVAISVLQTWYPKVVDRWARPDYAPAKNIVLDVHRDPNFKGLAGVAGTNTIFFNKASFKNNLEYSAGTVLHESVHILQSSTHSAVPGWFTEGVANYAKFGIMNAIPAADNKPLHPAPYEHYALDPYYSGALLLLHIDRDIDPTYVRRMMIAAHNGTVNTSFLSAGGKSLDQIWSEYRGISIPKSTIRSAINNKCIDVPNGDMRNDTKIQLWDCNGNAAQSISFGEIGDGTFGLIAVGKCLEAKGGTTNGTPVFLMSCGKENDDKWVLGSDGTLRSSVAPNMCLDVPDGNAVNGVQLRIWECNGSNAQRWVVSETVPTARSGEISFKSNAGKCLDDPSGNTANRTRVQVWDCNSLAPQSWVVRTTGGISRLSVLGACLDVENAGTASGTAVWLYSCNATKAQEWQIQSNGSLKNPNSGKCLDTANGSIANSVQFVLQDCNGSASQTFNFPG